MRRTAGLLTVALALTLAGCGPSGGSASSPSGGNASSPTGGNASSGDTLACTGVLDPYYSWQAMSVEAWRDGEMGDAELLLLEEQMNMVWGGLEDGLLVAEDPALKVALSKLRRAEAEGGSLNALLTELEGICEGFGVEIKAPPTGT